jgi:AhpD family alkylhydroperoxidase
MTRAPTKSISRLPTLPEPPTDPIAAEMFRSFEARGRKILNIHRMEMHSPKFFKAQGTFAGALRDDTVLSRPLSELIIVRTATLQNCAYVVSVHTRMARDCGVPEGQLQALNKWQTSSLFNEREKAALAFTDLMATDGKSVDDAAFGRAADIFSSQELLEIATICGFYIGNCRRTNALGLVPETE